MATQTLSKLRLTSKTQGLQTGLNKVKDLEKLGKTGEDAQKKLTKVVKVYKNNLEHLNHCGNTRSLGPVAGRITSLGTIIGNVGLGCCIYSWYCCWQLLLKQQLVLLVDQNNNF